jgi:hypothetical protein
MLFLECFGVFGTESNSLIPNPEPVFGSGFGISGLEYPKNMFSGRI